MNLLQPSVEWLVNGLINAVIDENPAGLVRM
jgi:hypothetical protein